MPGPGTWSAGDILTAADLNAIGTWTSYTPTVDQAGTRTATVNYAKYCQINKLVLMVVDLSVTATGSAGSEITVTLPVSAGVSGQGRGGGFFYDSSATDVILVSSRVDGGSTTLATMFVETGTSTANGLGSNPSLALGSGDVISFFLMYEAA